MDSQGKRTVNTELTASDEMKRHSFLKDIGIAVVSGSILTAVTLGLVWGVHSIDTGPMTKVVNYIYSLLFERGVIQFLTLFSFWFTAALLFLKHVSISREIKAFELPCIQDFKKRTKSIMGADTMINLLNLVEQGCAENRDLVLLNRLIKGLKQVKISQNQAEVANVLETVAGTDYSLMESSYSFIKFMIWLIPIFGFLGTLLGMSQAIVSFGPVFSKLGTAGFKGVSSDLQTVTGGLALAFDTTLLALILSAGLNLVSNNLQKRENDFLARVENFTLEYIINRFRAVKSSVPSEYDNFGSPEEAERRRQHEELVESINNLGNGFSENMEKLTREIKNLQRQQQVASNDNLAQLGRLMEELEKMVGKIVAAPKDMGNLELSPGSGGEQGGNAEKMDQVADAVVKSNKTIENTLEAMKEAVEKLDRNLSGSEPQELKKSSERMAEVIEQLHQAVTEMLKGSETSSSDAVIVELLKELNDNIKVMGSFDKLQGHLENNTKAIEEMVKSVKELAKANRGLGMVITNFINEKYFNKEEGDDE